MDFHPLQHIQASAILRAASIPSPRRSALRVWLPSRRLVPADAGPVLFHTGGAPGICPSERSPPERYPGVSTRVDPHTVPPVGSPTAAAEGRPDRPRFLGFVPLRESLATGALLTQPALVAPLGFTPSRHPNDSLERRFRRSPLTRFRPRRDPESQRPRVSVSRRRAESGAAD